MQFSKHKNKLFISLLIFLIFAGLACYIWNTFNIGLNKKYLLQKTIRTYTDLISVGMFDKAYDDFLTAGAKSRDEIKTYPVHIPDTVCENNCLNTKPKYSESAFSCFLSCGKTITQTQTITAKQKFQAYCVDRKNNWQDLKLEKIVFSGNNRADVRFIYKEKAQQENTAETWYYQDGKWLRDF